MHDPDATPKVSDTHLTWQAACAQAAEMCSAAAQGMGPEGFDLEFWHAMQASARWFERMEKMFAAWIKKPELSFDCKAADIRAMELMRQAATAMIEARRGR